MPSPDPASTLPLVVIVGPTGVGKTEVAIELAERLEGEIVSADSRLFYRGMNIGTAKPTPAQQARVPHHLIDIAEPDQIWSLAMFQERAQQVIREIHARRRLPFLVGGTGQYVRAVTQGWTIPKVEPNPQLREALETWAYQLGATGLHNRLAILDPAAAEKIDPRNLRRVVRALEVTLSTGHRFSEQRQQGKAPFRCLMLGLNRPRSELYARIDQRVDTMIDTGLEAEVSGLLERGFSPDLPSLSAIGYAEIIDYLRGRCSLEEAIASIKRNTRIFVRRQANWFKPDNPQIHWFSLNDHSLDDLEHTILAFSERLSG